MKDTSLSFSSSCAPDGRGRWAVESERLGARTTTERHGSVYRSCRGRRARLHLAIYADHLARDEKEERIMRPGWDAMAVLFEGQPTAERIARPGRELRS